MVVKHVTRNDELRAEAEDKRYFVRALTQLKLKELADFIGRNFDTLDRKLKGIDLDFTIDALHDGRKQAARHFVSAFKKSDAMKHVDTGEILYQRADPNDYVAWRIKNEDLKKRDRDKRDRAFKEGVVGQTFSLLKGTVSAIGLLWKPIDISAEVLYVTSKALGLNIPTRLSILAGAWMGTIGFAAAATDAAPYVQYMGDDVKSAFSEACTPDILRMDNLGLATYAVNFLPDGSDAKAEHAYYTMMAGAVHGVPPIALHLTSYFETNRFSDMMANNSTASNPFQFLNLTKLAYMKEHGQDMLIYRQAQERIESGTSSPNDHLLVLAVDEVRGQSDESLRTMLEKKRMEGPIHDGLRFADTSGVASELTALDMIEKYPEITDKNLNPDQILNIVINYYQKHHFLGQGNFTALQALASQFPDTPIIQAASTLGPKTSAHLLQVVDGNPTFFDDRTSAREGLTAIRENFTEMVWPEFNKYRAAYQASSSVVSTCLKDHTNPFDVPERISNFEATKLIAGNMYQNITPDFVKDLFNSGVTTAIDVANSPAGSPSIENIIQRSVEAPIPLTMPVGLRDRPQNNHS